jgi:hypothetical protein
MPSHDDSPLALWRRFRYGGDLRPLVCLAATVASGLLLAGLGVLGGYAVGLTRVDPSGRTNRIGNVRDDDIVTGLAVAGAAWLVLLVLLWRPAVRLNRHSLSPEQRGRWQRPFLITALLGGALTVVSYILYRQPWDDVEWAVTGLSLVVAGAAAVVWLPTVFGLEHARPVVGPRGRINVFCPQCGYSMVGLRETTCPECGGAWTIDELIREQGYGGGGAEEEPVEPVEPVETEATEETVTP